MQVHKVLKSVPGWKIDDSAEATENGFPEEHRQAVNDMLQETEVHSAGVKKEVEKEVKLALKYGPDEDLQQAIEVLSALANFRTPIKLGDCFYSKSNNARLLN